MRDGCPTPKEPTGGEGGRRSQKAAIGSEEGERARGRERFWKWSKVPRGGFLELAGDLAGRGGRGQARRVGVWLSGVGGIGICYERGD